MPGNRDNTPSGAGRADSSRPVSAGSWRGSRCALLVAVTVCVAVLGGMIARSFRRDRAIQHGAFERQEEEDGNQHTLVETWAKLFSEPAFSPQATIEDLKQEAMRVAGQVVEDCPHAPEPLDQMARLQYTFGKADGAVQLWQQCLELDPDFVDAYYGMGYVAWEKGEYAGAAQLFAEVSVRSPDDARIPFLLGDALMKQGKMKEAVAVLERSVRAQTASTAVVVCLAQAYLQLREYERAKHMFQVAIQEDPTHKQAHYGLATAYARLGQKDESRQCMEKFRTLATKVLREHGEQIRAFGDSASTRQIVTRTHTEAGKIYLEHANPLKAERMWQRAAVLDPEDVECRTHIARLYDRNGRFDEAIQVYQQLCRIDPENGDYWLDVGVLNGRLSRWDAALDAIQRAIELDPGNVKYQQTYDLVKKAK